MNDIEKEILENYRKQANSSWKRYERIMIMFFVLIAISILGLVAQHGMTLLYLYQYDYYTEVSPITTTTKIEQSTEGGGSNNFIGRDGDINYGEAESNDNKKDNSNPKEEKKEIGGN